MSLPVRPSPVPGLDATDRELSHPPQPSPAVSRAHFEVPNPNDDSQPSIPNQQSTEKTTNAKMGCLDFLAGSSSPLSSPTTSSLVPTPAATPIKATNGNPTSSAQNGDSTLSPALDMTRKSKLPKSATKKHLHPNLDDLDTIKALPPKPSKVAKRTPVKKRSSTPPPSTRPSRTRKAPERFADIKEKPKQPAAPRAVTSTRVFDPTFITTNSTSRLVKADVFHMLLEAGAWTSLSAADKTAVIQRLPANATNTRLLSKVMVDGEADVERPKELDINYDIFRTDVAKFKDDLYNGHLALRWQQQAEQAMIDRAAGKFDQWKREESERWWGQNMEVLEG